MSESAAIASMIMQRGSPARLRRQTARPDIWHDVDLIAIVHRGRGPSELAPDVDQNNRIVIISDVEIVAQHWDGPPLPGDMFVNDDGEYSVVSCETSRYGGQVLRHVLLVRGR